MNMLIDLLTAYFAERKIPVPQSPAQAGAIRYIDAGWVDSVGILEFVSYLEEKTAVRFSDEDLVSEEFQTLEGVAGILQRRMLQASTNERR